MLLLVLFLVTRGLLRDARFDEIGALTDPFGLSAFSITTKYWTAEERNSALPALSGVFLANRLIWLGAGLAVFAVAAWLFRYEDKGEKSGPGSKTAPTAAPPAAPVIASRTATLARLPPIAGASPAGGSTAAAPSPLAAVLMEASRRQDEFQRIAERLPPDGEVLGPAAGAENRRKPAGNDDPAAASRPRSGTR